MLKPSFWLFKLSFCPFKQTRYKFEHLCYHKNCSRASFVKLNIIPKHFLAEIYNSALNTFYSVTLSSNGTVISLILGG
jgi:hypothetical protein